MSKHEDVFGDRMKAYEKVEANRSFIDGHIICARIDGRGFSKFTRGFEKPFDNRVGNAMGVTVAYLVDHTQALIAYDQSDEITLIWQRIPDENDLWFNSRIQKMCSVLAGMATARFIKALYDDDEVNNEFLDRLPHFDCRVWQVPTREEAANVLMWRAMDARKNGISSACRAEFSSKQMMGKGQAEMKLMMLSHGVNYDQDYNRSDRFGDFHQRMTHMARIEDDIWDRIPEKNRPETREVERSYIGCLNLGYFGNVTNRVEVVFDQAEPLYKDGTDAYT